MLEKWIDIYRYEGVYKISTLGNVKRIDKCKDVIKYLIPRKGSGYMSCALCLFNKVKRKLVHRLVAEAFLPNPEKNHASIT